MSEDSPYKAPIDTQSVRRRSLWWWFLAGFVLVFCFLLLFKDTYPLNLSGTAVIHCKLWRYYLIEIRRVWNSGGTFGPESGSTMAALLFFLQHLFVSGIAGVVTAGCGAMMRIFRK